MKALGTAGAVRRNQLCCVVGRFPGTHERECVCVCEVRLKMEKAKGG